MIVRLIGGPKMGTLIAVPDESRELRFHAELRNLVNPNHIHAFVPMKQLVYSPSRNPKYWAYRGMR
jgi:hypothetical protein